jgi:hypothetical protein
MPKKPKHIQDRVDGLIKEKHITNEIIDLLKKEGHNVSKSYVSTRRKILKELEKKNGSIETSYSPTLSKDSIRLLFNLMGMLGKDNFDETIKTISDDYRKIFQQKFKHDLDNEKTLAQVFSEFEEAFNILESLDNNETQLKLFEKVKSKENPLRYYKYYVHIFKDGKKDITLFDFLSEYAIKYWEEVQDVSISVKYGYPFRKGADNDLIIFDEDEK